MSFIDFFGNVVRKKDVYFKYSTDEQWTGEYWIDGKKIYCKVVSVRGFTEDKYVAHNISNLHRVLSCDLFVKFNDGKNHMMPRAHKDNDHDGISIQVNKTNLILQVGQSNGFADATGYAILKYIKNN